MDNMGVTELGKKFRDQYESCTEVRIQPGVYMIARLDGRGFTKLTKKRVDLEKPFDVRFHEAMVRVVEHLLKVGLKVCFAYMVSDEISLLISKHEYAYNRRVMKMNSVLAGEASSVFELEGQRGAFDCRVFPVADEDVQDYFLWRQSDGQRNCIGSYVYWLLRERDNLSGRKAHNFMEGISRKEKLEFMRERNVAYEALPGWQREGTLWFYEKVSHEGVNPLTGELTQSLRNRLACVSAGDRDLLRERIHCLSGEGLIGSLMEDQDER